MNLESMIFYVFSYILICYLFILLSSTNRQVVAGTGNLRNYMGETQEIETVLHTNLFFSEILEKTTIIIFYL